MCGSEVVRVGDS
jgi:hypothetical protein